MQIRGMVGIALTGLIALLLSAPAARAEVDKDKIDAAADRAVAFLKASQEGQGRWVYRSSNDIEYCVGATALAGLALLESGVPRDDPALAAAARNVRNAAPSLKTVYVVSLAILFLDRYADHKELAVVRSLALRLAAAQNQDDGGWGYNCPPLTGAQENFWMGELKRFRNAKDFAGNNANGSSDNSNTQFAVLAMWVARNHKLPVEYPLFKAEWRFRSSQSPGGSWRYGGTAGTFLGDSPSMTCAGLLGLAVAYGARREQRAELRARDGDKLDGAAPAKPGGVPRLDIANDPAVLKAKEYLGIAIKQAPASIPHFMYFLWSLERASVTYKFTEYGGVDWYEYGSNLLVNNQQKNGSWEFENGPIIDTCFALLFLRKADLIGDISGIARLKADTGADPLKGAVGGTAAAKPKPGDSTVKELAKDKDPAEEAKKYLAEFPTAKPARQEEILEALQDTKDQTGNFTQALVELIPTTKDNLKVRVRSALAERLARQSLDNLRTKLGDMDIEIRIAAARAMGMKIHNDKPDTRAMPALMKLLTSSNEDLAAAAEQSLQALTERDFGRNPQRWQEFYEKLPASRR